MLLILEHSMIVRGGDKLFCRWNIGSMFMCNL